LTRCFSTVLLLGLVFMSAEVVAQPHAPPVPTEAPDDDPAPSTANADSGVAWTVVTTVDARAPVATGRGVTITLGDLVARMRDASGAVHDAYARNPALVRELVDRMIADRLIANEARRRGLENDPVVLAAAERALVARYRALVLNPVVDVSRPSDDEVRQWYEAHPERFHIPERRRARIIFTTSARTAAEVLRLALFRRRGARVHEFRRLAGQYNTDPHLASVAGDLRDVTPTSYPGALELDTSVRAALFEIERDDETLARVVEGRWQGVPGFFLVHLVSRRRAEERSLPAQSDWIRMRIMLERRVAAERERVAALERQAAITRVPIERALRIEAAQPPGDGGTALDATR
jgi:peptidyl-prolyl cis-trans isomerase C